MLTIKILLPHGTHRIWHERMCMRLQAAGHQTILEESNSSTDGGPVLRGLLLWERCLLRQKRGNLASDTRLPASPRTSQSCDLTVDVSGSTKWLVGNEPCAKILFDGETALESAAIALCCGRVPVIELYVNGKLIECAAPMADSRVFVTRGLDDVLARSISLICKYTDQWSRTIVKRQFNVATAQGCPKLYKNFRLGWCYLTSMLPRLVLRSLLRTRYYGGHWHVGYRFIDGPGVGETGSLKGERWNVLKDDRTRFYADPFPFEWNGSLYIFVEEVVHGDGKGVISVAKYRGDGEFSTPRKVLEMPYHLSYPQVFSRDGEVWMIPEAGSGRRVILFKSITFPDRWEEYRTLVTDEEIFDATLLDHGGMLWLIGTVRDGAGSASDMMVVFYAPELEGPWSPHPSNPVLIDKKRARPGGMPFGHGGELLLPIQDGSLFYGGGLGLARVTRLDCKAVEFTYPDPVDTADDFQFRHIHTLNRHGRLETIDGFTDRVRRN